MSATLTFEEFTAQVRSVYPTEGKLIDNSSIEDWICPRYTFIASPLGTTVDWFKPCFENRYEPKPWRVTKDNKIYQGETFLLAMASAHEEIFLEGISSIELGLSGLPGWASDRP